MNELTTLMGTEVTEENQAERNAEIAKLKEQMTKDREDINMESVRMAMVRAQIEAQSERVKAEAWRLSMYQNASNAVL